MVRGLPFLAFITVKSVVEDGRRIRDLLMTAHNFDSRGATIPSLCVFWSAIYGFKGRVVTETLAPGTAVTEMKTLNDTFQICRPALRSI